MKMTCRKVGAARHSPDRIAFADARVTASYATLHRAVRRVAAELQARGIARGDRVATYAPKQYETVVFMLAANLAFVSGPWLRGLVAGNSGVGRTLKRLPALARL